MSDETSDHTTQPSEPAAQTRPNPIVVPPQPEFEAPTPMQAATQQPQFAAPQQPYAPSAPEPEPAPAPATTPAVAELRARGAALLGGAPRFITGRYVVGAVSHLGVAVVTTLIVTFITILLLIIDLARLSLGAADGSDDTAGAAGSSDSPIGPFTAFRLLFGWIISLTFGGNVHGRGSLAFGDTSLELGLTLHGAPVLLTAAIAVLTVWAGIRIERLTPTPSWLWRVIAGAATGLVASGILSTLAATLGHGGIDRSSELDATLKFGAGGPGVFFTGWLVLGLAAIIGRQVGAWGGWHAIVTRAPAVVRDLTIWGSALAVVFGIAGLVLAVIFGATEHQFLNVLLTFPLWVGQLIVWLVTIGHFGSLTASAGGLESALDSISGTGAGSITPAASAQHLNVFSATGDGGGLIWIVFALAVLTVLWAGLRIGVARAQRPTGYVQRGLLVVLAAVIALVIPVLLTDVRIGVAGGSGVLGTAVHGSVVNAGWAFLVFAVAAVLIDVVATYLTPLVAAALPGVISAVGFGVLRNADGTAVPMTPAAKKASIWAGVGVGGLAVLAVLFFGAVSVLNSTVFTPQKPVAAYLDLIAKGDVKDAAAAQSDGDAARVKATQVGTDDVTATAKPTKTISHVKVLSTKRESDYAEVKVSYQLEGKTYTDTVEAGKKGGGLFDHWVISEPLTSQVEIDSGTDDSAEATLGGASVNVKYGEARFTVFPGVYSVAGKGSTLLTSKPVEVEAGKDGGKATLNWSYTQAATEQLQTAVNQWITENCMSSDSFDCYLESEAEEGDFYSEYDDVWKNAAFPVVTLDADGTFTTATPGSATVTWHDLDFTSDAETTKSAKEQYFVDGEFTVSGDTIKLKAAEASTNESELYYQAQKQSSGS
ncbi:hypothetical protein [Gryllotalpicola daejeonensis]|uniref:hypothetical protein n=1 Tax=Gryllotalpicola daejeonensis TaxID=993087 RepID=UPI0031D019CC